MSQCWQGTMEKNVTKKMNNEQEGIGLSARVEQCLSLMHENALMSQQVQVADKAVFMM